MKSGQVQLSERFFWAYSKVTVNLPGLLLLVAVLWFYVFESDLRKTPKQGKSWLSNNF